jgi:hypothetical protein
MKRTLLGFLTLVLLASGCSLGPREEWAKSMRDAFNNAEDASWAQVRQTVAIKAIETNIRQELRPLFEAATGVVDFSSRRARMDGIKGRKTKVVYDDLVVYATRSKDRSGAGVSGPDDDKAWARFDYEHEPKVDIDDNDRRMAVGAGLISPTMALELLDGVLTGSVREVGTGMKAGAETTRYSARLAPDAAVTDIKDEDRKEGVTRMFETLGVQQDDFPIDVWLDAEQRVRGLRFVMKQQKDRVNAFQMTSSWEFSDYGDAGEIDVPPRSETTRPDRFREFITELIREFG